MAGFPTAGTAQLRCVPIRTTGACAAARRIVSPSRSSRRWPWLTRSAHSARNCWPVYEKGDAEYLAAMRATQERQLLHLGLEIRRNGWRDADWQVQALHKTKENAQTRLRYFQNLIANGLIAGEVSYEVLTGVSSMASRLGGNVTEVAIGRGNRHNTRFLVRHRRHCRDPARVPADSRWQQARRELCDRGADHERAGRCRHQRCGTCVDRGRSSTGGRQSGASRSPRSPSRSSRSSGRSWVPTAVAP